MAMWLRLSAALLVTLVVIVVLELTGPGNALADRTPGEAPDALHDRPRELFWFLIFAVVMATSLLAAARRGREQLVRALRRRG